MTQQRKPAPPTRDEVLTWIGLTGKAPSEAVNHFWPGLGPAAKVKRNNVVRQWVLRARRGDIVVRDGPEPLKAKDIPKPDLAARRGDEPEDRLTFLRRELDALEADLASARREGETRYIGPLSKRVSEARAEFDQAMERERRIVRLDRTPGEISAELARRAEAIALRAEMFRRKAERKLEHRRREADAAAKQAAGAESVEQVEEVS